MLSKIPIFVWVIIGIILVATSIIFTIFLLLPNLQMIINGGASLNQIISSIPPLFGFFGGMVTLINSIPQRFGIDFRSKVAREVIKVAKSVTSSDEYH